MAEPTPGPPAGVATPPTTSPSPTPASPSPAAGSVPPPSASTLPPPPAAKLPPLIPYTGIPRISIPKKLPHRNWFVFAAAVTIPTYLWYDDREQAKRIKAEYIQRIKHLAEAPLEGGALGRVRTATVYAGRWPGEEDGKAAAWWKRYMKPYLVAAAIDYSLPNLPNYASLTELVAKQYYDFRHSSHVAPVMHTLLTPAEKRAQDVEGGVILVGRQSLKEYMEGLRRGWKEDRRDETKWISELDQSIFDDPTAPAEAVSAPEALETPALESAIASETEPEAPKAKVNLFPLTNPNPTSLYTPPPPTTKAPALPAAPEPLPALPPTPSTLPPHPPVMMIPYHPDLGFLSIPRSIAGWFNTRADTRLGGEAAMAFILQSAQADFSSPGGPFVPKVETRLEGDAARQGGELDWDLEVAEGRCTPKNFEKLPEQVEERMRAYYNALGPRVAKAWEIKKGRAYTDAEMKHTPPTLEELQQERIKRERRARQDLDGYQILRKGSGVAWDEAFEGRWTKWAWSPEAKEGAGQGQSEFAKE